MAETEDIDADIVISAVKSADDQKHLQWYRIHLPVGSVMGGIVKDASRDELIRAIESDRKKARTALHRSGEWVLGSEVSVVSVAGSKYLRTDQNAVAEDNLGELPLIDNLIQSGHVFRV